jgi:hypothetical protein
MSVYKALKEWIYPMSYQEICNTARWVAHARAEQARYDEVLYPQDARRAEWLKGVKERICAESGRRTPKMDKKTLTAELEALGISGDSKDSSLESGDGVGAGKDKDRGDS